MQPQYQLDGEIHAVTPLRLGGEMTLEIDGHRLDVSLQWRGPHEGELLVNGSTRPFFAAQNGNVLHLHLDGRVWVLESRDEFAGSAQESASAGRVHAPMPGVVVEIGVEVGDAVEAGQSLMLIESMKLQTEIRASIAGRVGAIGAQVGESFDKGAMLVDIAPEAAAGDGSE